MLCLHISTVHASVAIKEELIISTGVSTKVYNFNKNKGLTKCKVPLGIHIDYLIQFYFIAKNYFCKDIIIIIIIIIIIFTSIVRTFSKYILCSKEERDACWFGKTSGWVNNEKKYILY